jgi:glycosidase
VVLFGLAWTGCCGNGPTWGEPDSIALGEDETIAVELTWFLDELGKGDLRFQLLDSIGVLATLQGADLTLYREAGSSGTGTVTVAVVDSCGGVDELELEIVVEEAVPECDVSFSFEANSTSESVYLLGDFNKWHTDTPLTYVAGDTWTVVIGLEPGAYAYEFHVKNVEGITKESCDPQATLTQCDAGYEADATLGWGPNCGLGTSVCNSMIVVPDCRLPQLVVDSITTAVSTGSVDAIVSVEQGSLGAPLAGGTVSLDGVVLPTPGWTGSGFDLSLDSLSSGRHELVFSVSDEQGRSSEALYAPFWLEDLEFEDFVVYHALVDRIANGERARDATEGADAEALDFVGGDWVGMSAALPYLADLGINTLVVSSARHSAEGVFETDCGLTAAYQARWRDNTTEFEFHFGYTDEVYAFVRDAHNQGFRVLVEWPGGYVHEEHPWVTDEEEWVTEALLCGDDAGGGQTYADTIPERCWAEDYLPALDLHSTQPLHAAVEDILDWVQTYGVDGVFVPDVRQISRSVGWNLAARLQARAEHQGLDTMWLLGGGGGSAGEVASYVDGQWDAVYSASVGEAVQDTLAWDTSGFSALATAASASNDAVEGAPLLLGLGQMDETRFVTIVTTGDVDPCDTQPLGVASTPSESEPYDRIALAWSYVLTQTSIPYIRYGEEFGMPGYLPPDAHRALSRATEDLAEEPATTVEAVADRLTNSQADTLTLVAALLAERAHNAAFRSGNETQLWLESDLYAYARKSGADGVIVVLNRGDSARLLTLSLGSTGLATNGTYENLFTGSQVTAIDGELAVTVEGVSALVLVSEE